MAYKITCEFCDNDITDGFAEVTLLVSKKPVFVRHYCKDCFPKIKDALEACERRTKKIVDLVK